MRAVGRFLLWVVIGLIGTVAILFAALTYSQLQVPVTLPTGGRVFVDAWDRGYVTAEGTWVIDNDKHAYPINLFKIRCFKPDKSCTSSEARVSPGNVLYVEQDIYEITRWDDTTLTFITTAICTEYIYSIVRANARMVGTRTAKTIAPDSCPKSGPLALTLADGFNITSKMGKDATAGPLIVAGIAAVLWWIFIVVVVRRPKDKLATQ